MGPGRPGEEGEHLRSPVRGAGRTEVLNARRHAGHCYEDWSAENVTALDVTLVT